MRVTLVVFGPLTDRSGGYRYDLYLKRALEAAGHSVSVVSQPDGVPYRRQVITREGPWLDEVVLSAPDVLVVDELNHAAVGAPGINAFRRRLSGVPVVAVVHHLRTDEAPFRLRSWLRERNFLRRCDGWICNTGTTLARVRRVSGCRRSSAVVYPGTDAVVMPAGAPGTEGAPGASGPSGASGPPGAPGTKGATPGVPAAKGGGKTRSDRPPSAAEKCRVIAVGNVIPRKNLHRLVRAMAGMPGTTLDIFGDDTVDPACTANVTAVARRNGVSLVFHGRVSDEELDRAYGTADILAVPSLHEGFGIVYIEALKRGLPVVASVRGGATEIVTTPESGRLVRPRRTGEIRRALEELCDLVGHHSSAGTGPDKRAEEEERSRVQAGARERALFFSDWETSMAGAVRFLELTRKLIPTGGSVRDSDETPEGGTP